LIPPNTTVARTTFKGKRTVSDFLDWVTQNYQKPQLNAFIEATSETFPKVVNGSHSVALCFHTPTREPCKSFSPVFSDAVLYVNEEYPTAFNNTLFIRVDRDVYQDLKEWFAVTAYPWLVVIPQKYTNGTLGFEGERKNDNVGEWIVDHITGEPTMDRLSEVDGEELLDILREDVNVVALFSQKGCHPCRIFKRILNDPGKELIENKVTNTVFLNVDVGDDDYLKTREVITEYPTLKVFKKGSTYCGGKFVEGGGNEKCVCVCYVCVGFGGDGIITRDM